VKSTLRIAAVLRLGTVLALGAWLASCAVAPPPLSLRLGDVRQSLMTPIYVAQARGFFAEENLTVERSPFTSGKGAVDAMFAGSVDLATTYLGPVARAALEAMPIRIVSTLHRTVGNQRVIARTDRGVATPDDLNGKKIAMAPGTSSEYALSLLLRERGLDFSSVTIVATAPEQMAATLEAGLTDAVITWPPHSENTVAALGAERALVIKIPSYTEMSVLVGTEASLEANQEAVARFMKALVKAEQFIAQNPEASLALSISMLPEQTPAMIRAFWPDQRYLIRLDQLMLTCLANEASWLQSRGRDTLPTLQFVPFLRRDYLDRLSPRAVSLPPSP